MAGKAERFVKKSYRKGWQSSFQPTHPRSQLPIPSSQNAERYFSKSKRFEQEELVSIDTSQLPIPSSLQRHFDRSNEERYFSKSKSSQQEDLGQTSIVKLQEVKSRYKVGSQFVTFAERRTQNNPSKKATERDGNHNFNRPIPAPSSQNAERPPSFSFVKLWRTKQASSVQASSGQVYGSTETCAPCGASNSQLTPPDLTERRTQNSERYFSKSKSFEQEELVSIDTTQLPVLQSKSAAI